MPRCSSANKELHAHRHHPNSITTTIQVYSFNHTQPPPLMYNLTYPNEIGASCKSNPLQQPMNPLPPMFHTCYFSDVYTWPCSLLCQVSHPPTPHTSTWHAQLHHYNPKHIHTTTPLCQDVPLRTRSPMHTDTTQLVCPVRYTLTHAKKRTKTRHKKFFLPKTSTCRDGTKLDRNNTTTSPHHPYILCRFAN